MSIELGLRVPIEFTKSNVDLIESTKSRSDLTASETDKNSFNAALTNPEFDDQSEELAPSLDTISDLINYTMRSDE
jgi:hypothetical protein